MQFPLGNKTAFFQKKIIYRQWNEKKQHSDHFEDNCKAANQHFNFFSPISGASIERSRVKMSKRIKLSSHLHQQYLNSETADVFFECYSSESGQCEEIPAHKFVLIMGSEVFKSLFCSGLKEETASYRIDIATAEAFKEFLQLLYFDYVQLTVKNAPQVMDLVLKYQLPDCVKIFSDVLQKHFTKSKVCWAYQLARFTGQTDLKNICENQFVWHTAEVFKSVDFLSCPRSTLSCILHLDRLSCNEVDVLSACIAWARAACERVRSDPIGKCLREKLGYVLYQIRFRSMTIDEFSAQLATTSGLFEAEELEEIIQMIRSNDYKTKIFSGKIRMTTTFSRDPSVLLKCKLESSQVKESFIQQLHVGNVEKTTFSVTKPLLLGEFACAPLKSKCPDIAIPKSKLKIIEKAFECDDSKSLNGTVVTNTSITLKDNEAHYMLKKPIQVRPGFEYEIRLEHEFNEMFLKTKVFEQTVKHINDVTIQFHDRYGIISALYFNR